MRRTLIAGNWKMNTTEAAARSLAQAIGQAEVSSSVDLLICPPFPYLLAVRDELQDSSVSLGAQNVYFESPGAFTGEVATEMLVDCGCRYVILGHSERRHVLGECDQLINRKLAATLTNGLKDILCVGELLEERQSNRTEAVLEQQLSGGLAGLEQTELADVVIAYEPVWAIGTGVTATPEQAQEAHAFIRAWVAGEYSGSVADKLQILYGGSVKPDNAASLLSQTDVDGALVGGASLQADSFLGIAAAKQD